MRGQPCYPSPHVLNIRSKHPLRECHATDHPTHWAIRLGRCDCYQVRAGGTTGAVDGPGASRQRRHPGDGAENRSFAGWLNPAAFTNPPVATTIGQTDLSPMGGDPMQVRGPDFKRVDFSVFKGFRGVGTQRFEVRGVLDFSNTANFGRITALRMGSNDQRQIQLALKYYF